MLKNKSEKKTSQKIQFPGVYIEEIPTSLRIREDESGIPIFIGYTEKSSTLPIEKIISYAEFERVFGQPQKEINIVVDLDSYPAKANFDGPASFHNLNYSIKMFFENGGRLCYIKSCGYYKDIGENLDIQDFLSSLEELQDFKKADLIILPEMAHLKRNDYHFLSQKVLEFCKKNSFFSILDIHKDVKNLKDIAAYRSNFIKSNLFFGALYFPNLILVTSYAYEKKYLKIKYRNQLKSSKITSVRLNIPEYKKLIAALNNMHVKLPPSSAIAGIYQDNDIKRGVWKAPANIALQHVKDLEVDINNEENDILNVDSNFGLSINAIRNFIGRGKVVWGSRTLAGNDSEWRYVPVQRLNLHIERSIKESLKTITSLSNETLTWKLVESVVGDFFYGLWKQGALAGQKKEEAYFVNCGLGKTMTQTDINDNKLILNYGFAAIRPAEFISRILVFDMV